MKTAAFEKNRLEEKQRIIRRYKEKYGLEHKAVYFEEWKNPEDDLIYYKYNGTYFENDRKFKDWKKLPDLYSENLPDEVEKFDKKGK